ncbi:MAG: PAS domain S-box protein [Pyrinomonadaceae bacterium]
MKAPPATDEAARLDALSQYKILDTTPEQAFDDLTQLAAQICQTSMALISFVDAERLWFKSHVGWNVGGIPRDAGFCADAISQCDLFVVHDALADERFAAKPPVVSAPHIRFYTGAPLVTAEGYRLGTLCVLDDKPVALSHEQEGVLRTLARQVMTQLELRRSSIYLARVNEELEREIAVRKQAEEHVAFQASLLDQVHNAVVAAGLDGKIIYWNKAAQNLYRWTANEVIGKSIFEVTVPLDSRGLARDMFTEMMKRGFWEGEFLVRRKDKSTFPVHLVNTVITDAEGHAAGFVGISVDITERKRAEEALHQKTSLVRLLQLVAVAANEAATIEKAMQVSIDHVCAYTGWPVGHVYRLVEGLRDELASTGIWHLDDPKQFETFRKVTEDAYSTSKVGLPGRVLMTGKPVWIADVTKDANFTRAKLAKHIGVKAGFAFPVLVGMEVVAVLEFFSDEVIEPNEPLLEAMAHIGTQLGRVVERERARDALRRREEHFRSLIENASDIITILDHDGHIRYESPSVERLLGYKPEELIGRNIFEFAHDDDLSKVVRAFTEEFNSPDTTRSVEFRFRHKDESWCVFEAICKPLLDDSGTAGVVVNSRDISERRQLEEQLRQSQKMEAVGRLAGGVAHDFNNLLTAISGYSELMLRRLRHGDPLRHNAEEINKAGNRAASLTSQLLAFSRKQVLQPKVLDLNMVVADMDKMLRRLIGENIELVTMTEDELWSIKADPGQIQQVILNLVVNARDAMPEVGRLTIETANIELDNENARWNNVGAHPGRYVMLAVNDTGCGMDTQTRERVFEPFFTTKEIGKGTGLGLSTVYGIVKQSGGYIWVYSEPEKGTTFKIYLPCIEELADALPHRNPAGEMPQGRETVLLVEDEPLVRRLAARVLREQGYTVLEASNGEEALRVAHEHAAGEIHLLLTDVVMPRMSGREVAEHLALIRPRMLVLYTSGYTENSIVHHGVMEDGVAFLQKPFTPDDLARKVREVLDATHQSS